MLRIPRSSEIAPIYSWPTNWRWRCRSNRLEVPTNFSTGHLLSIYSHLWCRVNRVLRIAGLSESVLSLTISEWICFCSSLRGVRLQLITSWVTIKTSTDSVMHLSGASPPPPPPPRPRGIWLLRFARGVGNFTTRWGSWGGAHWPTPVCSVISACTGWGCLTISSVPGWEFRMHLTPTLVKSPPSPRGGGGGTLGHAIDRWLASLHILHERWSYRRSRAFGTNFHFLSVFVVSEKKFMVQGEDKLKGKAQANLERNRQRFERKKWTGSDLAASTRELAASTRP